MAPNTKVRVKLAPTAVLMISAMALAGCSTLGNLNPFNRGNDDTVVSAPLPPATFQPTSSVVNLSPQAPSAVPTNSVDSNISAVTRNMQVGQYSLGRAYTANGRQYIPVEDLNYNQSGGASWTGAAANGNRTANGETYNANTLTAAHPTLPFSSVVQVRANTGRSVVVRINDRGPFNGDIIDLSQAAAQRLGLPATQGNPVQVSLMQAETRKLAQLTGSNVGLPPVNVAAAPLPQAPVAPITVPTVNAGPIISQPIQAAPIQVSNIPATQPISQPITQPITQPVTTSSAPSTVSTGSVAALPDLPSVGQQASVNTGGGGISGSGFFVQAGSFSAPENADQLKGRLSSFGSTQVAQSGGAFRVLVGPFSSRQQAQAALGRVIGAGSFDATIVEQ